MIKRGVFGIGLFVLVVAAIGAYLTLFSVNEMQQALVLEFGKPKRVIKDAGLHAKIPFIQNVDYFDKRILELDTPPQEVIASDQKRLVVNAFARYRIIDPLLFYQAVRDEENARSRISTILDSSLRRVLGSSTFIAVVRDNRDNLMQRIAKQVNDEARDFGIDIVDVRIKRADLPEANSQAIYRRMQTERQREAAEIRAQGAEAAQRIRAQADRQVTVIKADASRDADKLRGQGDATRNAIFAQAYGRDPEFFNFYRSMQAYEAGLKSGDTRMLLSPNSEFFRYFNNSGGGTKGNETLSNPQAGSGAPNAQGTPAPEANAAPQAPAPNAGGEQTQTPNPQAEPAPPGAASGDAGSAGTQPDEDAAQAAKTPDASDIGQAGAEPPAAPDVPALPKSDHVRPDAPSNLDSTQEQPAAPDGAGN